MPQHTRNFFVKLTHALEEFCDPSRQAANPDGAASQACTPAPLRPPMPLSTQPFQLSPTTPPTPQPPSSTPTASPDAEPTIPAPIPAPSPSLALVPPAPTLSSTPSLQPQHFHARKMFPNAQGFTINNPQFIDISHTGTGLMHLFGYSMPHAFYNSSARYPPPKCHLGTRNEYIDLVTDWAGGKSDRKEPILWMHGPFGIGKSAVAQSCAEALAPINKLAATLFFSCSSPDRDDFRRVFTSIAYQVATKCSPFRKIINSRMIEDPALVTRSLLTQFEDLLVGPLCQVGIAGSGLDECVVIIDGLDECQGIAEQCEIIKIIAASVHKRTTPFRWFITSRPDESIIRTMNSSTVSPVRSPIELPVSRAIDHEILVYLTGEFKMIREDHSLPESWPSEGVLALLVERGAGLWIYVATMARFIKDKNSFGPEDQLSIVLEFAKDVSANVGPDNPLAEMDFFYALIMQRIPPKVRTTVQTILLAHSVTMGQRHHIISALCFSAEQLRRACASIQSVIELQSSDFESLDIKFYHTSFLYFMKDPQRSRDLCIYGIFLVGRLRELLAWLHKVYSHSTDSSHIVFPSDTVLPEGVSGACHYFHVLGWFWRLCEVLKHPLDSQTAMLLAEIPFQKMLWLLGNEGGQIVDASQIRDNLPAELRDKILRKGKCPIPECMNTENVWILGHGENKTVPRRWDTGFVLLNNQDWPSYGKCFCGAYTRRGHDEAQNDYIEVTDNGGSILTDSS